MGNYNEADHPREPAGSPNGTGGRYAAKPTMCGDDDLAGPTPSALPGTVRACLPHGWESAADGMQRMERLGGALIDEAWAQHDRRTLAYGDPCYLIDDGLDLDVAMFEALPPLEQERYRAWTCGADRISDDAWNDLETMQYIASDAYAANDEAFYYTDANPGYFEEEMERLDAYVDVPLGDDLERMGVDRNTFAEAFDTMVKGHPRFRPAVNFDDGFAFEDGGVLVTPIRHPDGSWRLYGGKQLEPFATIPRLEDDPREYQTMCTMMRRALDHMNEE